MEWVVDLESFVVEADSYEEAVEEATKHLSEGENRPGIAIIIPLPDTPLREGHKLGRIK